jgi:hypothetical protein
MELKVYIDLIFAIKIEELVCVRFSSALHLASGPRGFCSWTETSNGSVLGPHTAYFYTFDIVDSKKLLFLTLLAVVVHHR